MNLHPVFTDSELTSIAQYMYGIQAEWTPFGRTAIQVASPYHTAHVFGLTQLESTWAAMEEERVSL